MLTNQFSLFATRRFMPLFVTQFLGAFNDNVVKNALLVMITYQAVLGSSYSPGVMVALASGLFILPFFLFSATAGMLADKFDKARLIRHLKLFEFLIMIPAAVGFWTGHVELLLGVLFLLGAQAALFGPLKYGVIPDLMKGDELVPANGLVGAGTFLSILLGTIYGGMAVMMEPYGPKLVAISGLAFAALGYAFSRAIPPCRAAAPGLAIRWNILAATRDVVRYSASHSHVFQAIVGISWFWFVGATFLAQLPTFAKETLGGNENVFVLFLSMFTVGVGLGALLCNRLLKGKASAALAPVGALGMTLFIIDLYLTANAYPKPAAGAALLSVSEFFAQPGSLRLTLDLLATALFGGLYIVPLYALVQKIADPHHRSRVIASNNVLNALFMVASALYIIGLLKLGLSVAQVFLSLAFLNGLVAIYLLQLLPEALAKGLGRMLFSLCFRVEVKGLENFEKAGARAVIISNHVSFLDAPALALFLPEEPVFAINLFVARNPLFKPFISFARVFEIDPSSALSIKDMVEFVKQDKRLVIFPEGRITTTGALMKIYEGPAMIADKANATILPVKIDGAEYSRFSKLHGKRKLRWFPKLTITILPPVTLRTPEHLVGKQRRKHLGQELSQIMTNTAFTTQPQSRTLFQGLLDGARLNGGTQEVLLDIKRSPANYNALLTKTFALGRALNRALDDSPRVGLMLPNSTAAVVSFFSLQAYGRVVAMLNFTAGAKNLVAACETATVRHVITSRAFIEAGKLHEEIEALAKSCTILYLEDIAATLRLSDKLAGVTGRLAPQRRYQKLLSHTEPNTPAVILFTSGSEGTPKGVVLSHTNLMSNLAQMLARADFGPSDVVLNALPMFHSFGLMAGTLMPLFAGIKAFQYPSPRHFRIIPELCYDIGATVLFGTDTFLSKYARNAHPYDFHTLRYVFAGAEKLREETRQLWMNKFGVRIFEGYGVTETSPVLAGNTAMDYKAGTVGKLVPGMEMKLLPVPGIDTGGRLYVSGPNVMMGYMLANNPGVLQPTTSEAGPGWHDTGDIVEVDDEGYIRIVGRAKRFAKIGGEMVSLTAVEEWIYRIWPEAMHAVVAVSDAKKGEQLILITEQPGATLEPMLHYIKQHGISELGVPKRIQTVEKMPLLGTGKTDYQAVKALVVE